MSQSPDFESLLGQYRDNYLQYVTTGTPQYKSAYQTVLDAITSAIQSKKEQAVSEQSVMSSFMDDYKKNQDAIQSMEDQSADTMDSIQKVTDGYASAEERYKSLDTTASVSPGTQRGLSMLLRVGIILLLIPLFFLIGYFFPGETFGIFNQSQVAVQQAAAAATAAVAAVTPRFGAYTPGTPYIR
jgi:membrane-associated HD superfamily phosphohydrolase